MTLDSPNIPSSGTMPLSLEELRRHNASMPICLLNYDIITKIFMLNTVLDLESPHNPIQTTRWTSQVCHSWRSIMLDYPMLWAASVDFGDPLPWLKEVILRAGSVLFDNIVLPSVAAELMGSGTISSFLRTLDRRNALTITEVLYLLGHTVKEERVAWVAPYLPKCRRFFIKIPKNHGKYIVENVSQPSPNLHTFSVIIKGSQQVLTDFTLPEDAFSNHAPHLRVLDLRGCMANFSSSVFWNLTTLAIRKPSSSQLPTAIEWLEILGNMKDLRTLVLVNAVSLPNDEADIAPLVASLPNLKSLTLHGNSDSCSILYTHLDINFESLDVINIQCYKTRLDEYFNSTISCLQHHLNGVRITPSQSSLAVSCTPTGLKFTKLSRNHADQHNKELSFSWFASYTDPNIMAIFPAFLGILQHSCSDVPQLRLDFNHSDALFDSRIIDILLVSPKVEKLSIMMDYSLHRLLPILNAQDTADQLPLLSSLETVILEYAHFEEGDSPNDIKGLVDFARKRSLMGSAIKDIVFVQCGDVANVTTQLDELGANVTFLREPGDPVTFES